MQPRFIKALLELLAESNQELLDLDVLAQKTGYSKYHLCRAFHAATHEPLQTYLRRLRLAQAAQSLLHGKRILDVALDTGYQSQEAFHRAFTRMFGITPKALQKGEHHPSLLLKQPWQHDLMPPAVLPCTESQQNALTLKGMGGRFNYDQIARIIALWQAFHQRFPDNNGTYGVTLPSGEDDQDFLYFAALPDDGRDWPADMITINVPEQRYKVFRYQGRASNILSAFNYIWGVWLPEQHQLTVSGIDFEYYPPGYDPDCDQSWVDIHIPVSSTKRGVTL